MPIFIALISWSDAWRSSSGAFLIADSIFIGLLIIDEIELIPFSCIRWKPSPIEPDIQTEGILYLKPPEKFFWHYQNPYSQKIISNGSILWIFDEDLEQVTIKNIDNSISKTPAGIILADDSIQEHFVQTSLGVIENFDWIELTPRYIEAQYDYINIGFNKKKLGMMIIADNLGQTTRIDFSSVQKNTALSASFFNFDIPKNIDIFDERK